MIPTRPRDTRNLLVALDIGTSKIVTLVAEITPEDTLTLIGMGSHPSRGLKKGVVVNIESTVNAIQRSLEEAELMADAKIKDVITGIAGSHIKSFNSHGMVAIKDKEVQQYDVDRVIETARAVNIPMEQQVLHILEQEFIIDGQGGVRQPMGMSGMRLEVKVHIVTGAVSAAQNIMKCVRRCGLEVRDLMLQPLASADAVLLEDERDLGVCLVDIGGGTTDMAVFTDGAIKHTSVIPIAGDQITNDIAMALRTPTKDAEELKIAHGVALRQLASSTDMIEVPGVGDRGCARALAPDAGRGDRAARRGALFADPARAALLGARGAALLGDRDHRRLRDHEGHGGAGRGGLPHAGARRPAELQRSARRGGAQPALLHRHGPADGGAGPGEARPPRAHPGRRLQGDPGTDEGLVQGKLLGAPRLE